MTVEEKAERLLLTRAVLVRCANNMLYATVIGDHGEYRLVRETGRWRCPCPARKKCSHIEAVERVTEPR